MQVQIDIDYLKTIVPHFCIPCYGGNISEQTFMSMMKYSAEAQKYGLNWQLDTLTNESLISRGRNTLSAKFLVNTKTTHLFFIDADIGFEPWHILAVLNMKKDIAAGLYPMKQMPLKWVINTVPGAKDDPNDTIQEVTKAGTGFMCIKRDVFTKLKEHPKVHKFTNDIGLPTELDPQMYTFFDTDVRDNRYYSEDWTFCENWRDLGGQVFIDKRVLLKHLGYFNFSHEAETAVRKAVAESPSSVITKTEDTMDNPTETSNTKLEAVSLASSKETI